MARHVGPDLPDGRAGSRDGTCDDSTGRIAPLVHTCMVVGRCRWSTWWQCVTCYAPASHKASRQPWSNSTPLLRSIGCCMHACLHTVPECLTHAFLYAYNVETGRAKKKDARVWTLEPCKWWGECMHAWYVIRRGTWGPGARASGRRAGRSGPAVRRPGRPDRCAHAWRSAGDAMRRVRNATPGWASRPPAAGTSWPVGGDVAGAGAGAGQARPPGQHGDMRWSFCCLVGARAPRGPPGSGARNGTGRAASLHLHGRATFRGAGLPDSPYPGRNNTVARACLARACFVDFVSFLKNVFVICINWFNI